MPAEVQNALAAVQQTLKGQLRSGVIGWTRLESTHLTLRFLGAVPVERFDPLVSGLRTELAGFASFQVTARGLGCFPGLQRPRVIWAGVSNAENRLPTLRQRVVHATNPFTDQPVEERFVGHVTLGRFKQVEKTSAGFVAKFVEKNVDLHFGTWLADRVQLIRSQLSSTGSVYTIVSEFPLLNRT